MIKNLDDHLDSNVIQMIKNLDDHLDSDLTPDDHPYKHPTSNRQNSS
jgi:hypothetical protein